MGGKEIKEKTTTPKHRHVRKQNRNPVVPCIVNIIVQESAEFQRHHQWPHNKYRNRSNDHSTWEGHPLSITRKHNQKEWSWEKDPDANSTSVVNLEKGLWWGRTLRSLLPVTYGIRDDPFSITNSSRSDASAQMFATFRHCVLPSITTNIGVDTLNLLGFARSWDLWITLDALNTLVKTERE